MTSTTDDTPSLTLYDIVSAKGHLPFSPHTWQTRLALNYKQLPYRTIWLELVDIKPTLQRIGAEPSFFMVKSNTMYTLPVLVDTSRGGAPVVVSHTLSIAEYLDATYPARPLFPPGSRAALALFDRYIMEKVFPPLFPILTPKSLPFLTERDKVHFRETRERFVGVKLEELSPEGPVREGHWEKVREGFDDLAELLSKNGDDTPWFLGDQVSKSDFVVVAALVVLSLLDPERWERVRTWNGGRWQKLMDASEEWRRNQA